MKLGLVSAILAELDFYQMIDCIAGVGYQCVEVACWPRGKIERRYAGVAHIDVDNLDDGEAGRIRRHLAEKNVAISALAYYPNTMGEGEVAAAAHIAHLKKLIDAAVLLDVDTVATFVGRVPDKPVAENLALFSRLWPPLVGYAKQRNIRIAIENCPMLFSKDEWPGGKNLAASPAVWREMFSIIPGDNFGLNYDPSHFIWQQMDYIAPLYEFRDRIFHVHFKDIRLYRDKLLDVGILAAPLEYMRPVLVGLGDVEWDRFVCGLNDIGYDGFACVEVEDKAYENGLDSIVRSLILSKRYLDQYVI